MFCVKGNIRRRGSRGGEMGEFSPPAPPPPHLFLNHADAQTSNTSTRLWFYYIITKIHPPFQSLVRYWNLHGIVIWKLKNRIGYCSSFHHVFATCKQEIPEGTPRKIGRGCVACFPISLPKGQVRNRISNFWSGHK